ncbi:MAG TPA: CDP-alcohol phosphatidyltransferase family protein, partial [Vicinamibacterales bacterium]|nr:CDP-alcohol phosphatidyltransferase family protein [Vicinamibacterales bacterium]
MAFRRRPKFNIVVFTVTVLVAVGALVIADLWWRRDRVLKAADTRAANLATVLAEYVRGSFGSADAALRQLAVHGRRIGGPTASHDDWDPILASAKAALPESGSISVTNAAGTITHSTIKAIVGESRSDSYVYQRLSKGGVDEMVLDRPYPARAEPRQYIIPVGRPIVTADGRFDGILVATVMPQAYRAFFNTIDVGHGGVISVLHPDGVVLFREPSETSRINEAAADDPLLKLAQQQPMGLVHAPLTPGGPTHISAYRTVGHPPVVVAVSLSEDDVLEDWRRERRVSATAFGALTLTLGAVVVALFRVVDARERAERELIRRLRKPVDGIVSRTINRRVSLAITSRLIHTNVTPNQMTVVANVIGALGVFFVWQGSWAALALGAFLVQMQSILDGCDGEIARLKFAGSKMGEWLDNVLDDGVNVAYGLALGVASTKLL